MRGALKSDEFIFRPSDVQADLIPRLTKQRLPSINLAKDHLDHLRTSDVAASRVDPDNGLILFGAQQDHVVIGRDHHLPGSLRVGEHHLVIGPARRCARLLMPDIAHIEAEGAQGRGDTPWEELVEEQTDAWPSRRSLVLLHRQGVVADSSLEVCCRRDVLEFKAIVVRDVHRIFALSEK